MKKLLLLSLLFAGCATHGRPDKDPEIQASKQTEEKIEPLTDLQIRSMIAMQSFFIDSNHCFTVYAICLGEKKLEEKACWSRHEQCVINVGGMYKLIFLRLKQLEQQQSGK